MVRVVDVEEDAVEEEVVDVVIVKRIHGCQ
jgi:hypothetical protein